MRLRRVPLLVPTAAGLAVGGVAALLGASGPAHAAWAFATACGLVPAVMWVVQGLRRRRPGVDVVAVLALVGALATGELLAGAVIAVMLATGHGLESWAAGRARAELETLLALAPHTCHRYTPTGELESVDVAAVLVGDRLLVRTGEVVPVDGRVAGDGAVLDEATLTGESLPVERAAGDPVRSGAVNAGPPFALTATATAADSTYAGIVRMVQDAQADAAPFVRLADRYAAVFVPAVLVAAGIAWGVSGDAVRAVAVLVVATPCPLILAAPIAVVSGMSGAARRGVVVRDGGALERLASVRTALLDKTGTLTAGRPAVADVQAFGGTPASEVLRLAASAEQASPHVLATAVVRAAEDRGLHLSPPQDVEEVHGKGLYARVDGRTVAIGRAGWDVLGTLGDDALAVLRRAALHGSICMFVVVDGQPAGALLLEDPVRPDAAATVRRLRRSGISKVVLLTGDRAEVGEVIGGAAGVDRVLAGCSPADKVDAVAAATHEAPTLMVGDGVNDAPALARATIGVAITGGGRTAAAEAADVLLVAERLDRLADAVVLARRSHRIALQSVLAGMGLSALAMVAAGWGLLTPAVGAVVQEVIDLAAIGNALRALSPGRERALRLDPRDAQAALRYSAEHPGLRDRVESLRAVADALDHLPPAEATLRVQDAHRFLVEELLPHEEAEEHDLYPRIARTLGGEDPTATMSRAHAEIAELVRQLGRLVDDGAAGQADVRDLRRVLYGLHAVLRLHFAQEEEGYFVLAEESSATSTAAPRTRSSASAHSASSARDRG